MSEYERGARPRWAELRFSIIGTLLRETLTFCAPPMDRAYRAHTTARPPQNSTGSVSIVGPETGAAPKYLLRP